jgi:hypothetical protein
MIYLPVNFELPGGSLALSLAWGGFPVLKKHLNNKPATGSIENSLGFEDNHSA